MDDTQYLRYRNVALETELRLAKEQLAQVQQSMTYLVTCLSNQSGHRPVHFQNPGHAETRALSYGQDQLTGLTSGVPTRHRAGEGYVPSAHLSPAHRSGPTFLRPGTDGLETSSDEELLTFDDPSPSSSQTTVSPASTSFSQTTLLESPLIDSSIDTPLTPFTPSHLPQDVSKPKQKDQHIGPGISNPTASSIVKEDIEEWQACRPPSPAERVLLFTRAFANHEHNRLMGCAVFIEDMSEAEKLDHWVDFARESGRHSAEEWKLYYDEVVRPAFLAKMGARAVSETIEDGVVGGRQSGAVDAESGEAAFAQGLQASRWAPNAGDRPSVPVESTADLVPSQAQHVPRPDDVSRYGAEMHPQTALRESSRDHERTSPVESRDDESKPPAGERRDDSSPSLAMQDESSRGCHSPPKRHEETSEVLRRGVNHEQSKMQDPSVQPCVIKPYQRLRPRLSGPPTRVADILFNFTSTNPNLYHTVLISNIPPTTTLVEVVSKVHGGRIVSAKFLETAGMKTKPPIETNAAMIVFLGAWRAKAYVDFCRNNAVSFVSADANKPPYARVELVKTPTRPLHPQLLADIVHGLTRVLFIIDREARWTVEEVVDEFARSGVSSPLKAGRDAGGMLSFEFAEARDAGAAWGVVERFRSFFGEVSKGFLEDPCATALGWEDRVDVVEENAIESELEKEENGAEDDESKDEGLSLRRAMMVGLA